MEIRCRWRSTPTTSCITRPPSSRRTRTGSSTASVFGEADPDRGGCSGVPRALAGPLRDGVGGGRWPRSRDRPAPVGASRAASGALPFTLRSGRMVDPQPAQAPDPGDSGSQTPVRGAWPGVPASRRPVRSLPDSRRAAPPRRRFPAWSRSASTASTRSLGPRSRGDLDPARLLGAMTPEEAMAALQQLPGIGPMYAGLILLRSTGATDILTLGEPRLASYISHYYGLDHGPRDPRPSSPISPRPWRPFRTWASVLIRVAGDRDGVAWEPQSGGAGSGRRRSSRWRSRTPTSPTSPTASRRSSAPGPRPGS